MMTEEAFDKWQIPNLDNKQASKVSPTDIANQKKLGFDQGYQEGLKKAQDELNQTLSGLTELIAQIKAIENFVEPQALEAIRHYCQHLIKEYTLQAVEADENVIKKLIDEGISQLANKSRITVEISQTLYENHIEALKSKFEDKGISIEPNANLSSSQVIVKSDMQTLKSDLLEVIQKHFASEDMVDD